MIGGPWVGITVAQGEATNWNIGIMAFQQFVAVATAYAGGAGIFASLGPVGGAITEGAMIGALTGGASSLVFQAAGYKVNFWKSVLSGAVSGAISGAIGAHFGKTWDLTRVGLQSLNGGIAAELGGGDFSEGFLTSLAISVTTYVALAMREYQVELSKKFQIDDRLDGVHGEWDLPVTNNSSGLSIGFNGDGFKLGGGRIIELVGGGFDVSDSPLGGPQGGLGRFGLKSWKYSKGSLRDYAVEAFGGVHDTWSTPVWYNLAIGNSIQGSRLGSFLGEAWNYFGVLPSAPVVVGSMIGTSGLPYQTIVRPR